jgi:cytidylate kinase
MSIIIITGETGCRSEDLARATAQRLSFELIHVARLGALLRDEFGDGTLPDKAWGAAASSVIAHAATEHHLVVAALGAECLLANVPGILRVFIIAGAQYRTGNLMLDSHADRSTAAAALREIETNARQERKRRVGKTNPTGLEFDLILNAGSFEPEQMAAIVEHAATMRGLTDGVLLTAAAESQLQFQMRLQLARFGIVPARKAAIKKNAFVHPSEELFANLLDFYRIEWEYEPRSFPLQWDKQGKVMEAFTPDFYLPEFDLYVELTTMKQSLVTKKNRKIKLLRAIYPHVNIQVFYQKDFQDLVAKYGLSADRVASS